jgi:hypothetical protein
VIHGYDPRAHLVVNDRWVDDQNTLAGKLRQLPPEERADAHCRRAWVLEILPLLEETLRRAQLPVTVLPTDKEGMTDFLRELPTLWAWTELVRLQHENPERQWKPQDFNDLRAFGVAIVHCDIVVFEKHWSDLARRAKLDTINCTALCRIEDLVVHLVSA